MTWKKEHIGALSRHASNSNTDTGSPATKATSKDNAHHNSSQLNPDMQRPKSKSVFFHICYKGVLVQEKIKGKQLTEVPC